MSIERNELWLCMQLWTANPYHAGFCAKRQKEVAAVRASKLLQHRNSQSISRSYRSREPFDPFRVPWWATCTTSVRPVWWYVTQAPKRLIELDDTTDTTLNSTYDQCSFSQKVRRSPLSNIHKMECGVQFKIMHCKSLLQPCRQTDSKSWNLYMQDTVTMSLNFWVHDKISWSICTVLGWWNDITVKNEEQDRICIKKYCDLVQAQVEMKRSQASIYCAIWDAING